MARIADRSGLLVDGIIASYRVTRDTLRVPGSGRYPLGVRLSTRRNGCNGRGRFFLCPRGGVVVTRTAENLTHSSAASLWRVIELRCLDRDTSSG